MGDLAAGPRAHLDEAWAALGRQREEAEAGCRRARVALERERDNGERLRARLAALDGQALERYSRTELRTLFLALAEREAQLARLRAAVEGWEFRLLVLAEQASTLARLRALLDASGEEAPAEHTPSAAVERWLAAQDAEHARLAAWLHDRVAQPLHSLVLQIEVGGRLLRTNPERAAAELAALPELAARLLGGVRRAIFELRPMSLDDLGLCPTLEHYVQLRREAEGLVTRLVIRGRPRRLAPSVELGVFHVIGAALDNVRDHAGGAEALVTLSFEDETLVVTVVDRGPGCDLAAVAAREHGLGLLSMQVRARQLGGQLELASADGHGMQVCLTLPLARAAASSGERARQP